jgi:hypothetical protein
MAYAMGRPLKPAPEDEVKVDYGPLLGFAPPAVRIDPHAHEVDVAPAADLRKIADIIRDRGGAGLPPDKPTE